MKSQRKFYEYTVTIKVLADEELTEEYLAYLCCSDSVLCGDFISTAEISEPRIMDAVEAASAILASGSDPEFFSINCEGEEV